MMRGLSPITAHASAIAAAALACAGASCREPAPVRASTEATPVVFAARSHANVFFVGHSLINFEMPKNMEVMAKSLGLELEWNAQIIDGAPLEVQVKHPERTQSMRVDEALHSGFYDTLVMTESVPIGDALRYRDTPRHAATLAERARRDHPDARVFLAEVWMHRDRPRGSPFMKRLDWRRFLDDDLPTWESVADAAGRRSGGVPVAVLPAGRAIGKLVDAISEGDVPGIFGEEELFADQVHLTPLGNHFVAAVTLAAIYQRTPSGASGEVVDRDGRLIVTLPERTREALYQIAWNAVSSYARASTSRDFGVARGARTEEEP
jgi:hypothetical protein